MLRSIEGIFRNGKIELLEPAPNMAESRVIVTFLPTGRAIDLKQRGIEPEHAASLKWRLKAFEEDWNLPEMDVYDVD